MIGIEIMTKPKRCATAWAEGFLAYRNYKVPFLNPPNSSYFKNYKDYWSNHENNSERANVYYPNGDIRYVSERSWAWCRCVED